MTKTEIISIELSLLDNKNAIAPGMINNPIANTNPTAFNVAIITNDKALIDKKNGILVDNPRLAIIKVIEHFSKLFASIFLHLIAKKNLSYL